MKTIAREIARVARMVAAGDEWADDATFAFVNDLAKVMSRDRTMEVQRVRGNRIDFVHSPNFLVSVPLVLTVTEFGYPPTSESLNGTMFSEQVRNFRIPGGTTRRRDPVEFWKNAKDSLDDVLKRAGM